MVNRSDKIRKALIKEVSNIIQSKVKDPRISGIISVIDVNLSADNKHAKIYLSVLGCDKDKENTMKAIESSAGFIRSEVSKRIQMRFTPELQFKLDDSLERGSRVSNIIDKISKGEL